LIFIYWFVGNAIRRDFSQMETLPVHNRILIGMVTELKPGTYALVLSCESNARIQIGRLGKMQLQPGYYVYVGSALGLGGLRARITHHQKTPPRPHWHIDYLRAHTQIHCIWFSYGERRREHQWARAVQTMSDAKGPLLGFGASDCDCRSHLYFFKHWPSRISFQRGLGRRHPPVEEFLLESRPHWSGAGVGLCV
jgi:Uri superfamily endonuclease